jgi:hypothetical protein
VLETPLKEVLSCQTPDLGFIRPDAGDAEIRLSVGDADGRPLEPGDKSGCFRIGQVGNNAVRVPFANRIEAGRDGRPNGASPSLAVGSFA